MDDIDFMTILIRDGIDLHDKFCNMDNITCYKKLQHVTGSRVDNCYHYVANIHRKTNYNNYLKINKNDDVS